MIETLDGLFVVPPLEHLYSLALPPLPFLLTVPLLPAVSHPLHQFASVAFSLLLQHDVLCDHLHRIQLAPVLHDTRPRIRVLIIDYQPLLRPSHTHVQLLQVCAQRRILLLQVGFLGVS